MSDWFSVHHLTAGYRRQPVLHDISFHLPRGELCALLGANGCGKSTLLRTICGLLPGQGQCILQGVDLWTMSTRQRALVLGYLAQSQPHPLALTALEMVLMGFYPSLGLLQRPSHTQRRAAMELMEQLGCAEFAPINFSTLSQGQQQLVLVARTLVSRPQLLLLDEPDSALDYPNRHVLMTWLQNYSHCHNISAILCSHDVQIALRYAHRLLLLQQGHIIQEIVMKYADAQQLTQALSQIYGPVEVFPHQDYFMMTQGGNGVC